MKITNWVGILKCYDSVIPGIGIGGIYLGPEAAVLAGEVIFRDPRARPLGSQTEILTLRLGRVCNVRVGAWRPRSVGGRPSNVADQVVWRT
jgi:hypothetical protein